MGLFSERKGFHTVNNSHVLWRCGNQNISPNVSQPIAVRKVRALVAFFQWAHSYFKTRNQAHLFINMRAFVSRVAMFSRYTPKEVIEESIAEFCKGHNISFLCSLVRILVNIKR